MSAATTRRARRQLAQEMIVNENVAVLGGLEFTTTALAMPDMINEAKIPFVAFNTATSVVTDKSPYLIRAGFTQWQALYPRCRNGRSSRNTRRAQMFVADYAPGEDAIAAFTYGFHQRRRQDARSDQGADGHDRFLELFPARP